MIIKSYKNHDLLYAMITLLLCVSCQGSNKENDVENYFDGKKISPAQLDSIRKIYPALTSESDFKNNRKNYRITKPFSQKAEAPNLERTAALYLNTIFHPFSLPDINGQMIDSKKLMGQVVVINFWFTGCVPCVQEMPELNMLAAKYNSQQARFIAFTFNSTAEIKQFLNKHEFDYVQVTDAGKFLKGYNINIFPTHLVIDKRGYVKLFTQGYRENTSTILDKTISELVKE